MASVLVVDDDQTVRQILEKLLRRSALATHGVKIDLAEDGEEALALLAKRKVDVVVLDLLMPGKSGLDVARTMRQLEGAQGGAPTKIMFMSGVYPERTLNKELVQLKATFFTKPKGIVDIPAAIEKALGFAPAPAPSPQRVAVPVSAATPPSGLAALARTPLARTPTPSPQPAIKPLSNPFQTSSVPAVRDAGAPRTPSIMPTPIVAPRAGGVASIQPRPLGTPVVAAPTPAPRQPPAVTPPGARSRTEPVERPRVTPSPIAPPAASNAPPASLAPIAIEPTPSQSVPGFAPAGAPPPAARAPSGAARATATPTAPPRVPSREVDLGEVQLPSLLLELAEQEFSGIVEIRRNRIERALELDAGHVIDVTSNQRLDTLGQFLVVRGVLKPDQHEEALAKARETGVRLGEVLVALGFVTTAQLVTHLREQMRHKLAASLRWTHGSARLFPREGDADRARGAGLDLPSAIFAGLREGAVVEDAAKVATQLAGQHVAFNARGHRHEAAFAQAFGATLANALTRGASAEEFFRIARHEAERALPGIEALLLCGAITISATPIASASTPAPTSAPAPVAAAPAPEPEEPVVEMEADEPPPAPVPADLTDPGTSSDDVDDAFGRIAPAPVSAPHAALDPVPAEVTPPVAFEPLPPSDAPAAKGAIAARLAELAARRGAAAPVVPPTPPPASPAEALYDSLFADVQPEASSPELKALVRGDDAEETSGMADIRELAGEMAVANVAREELQRELIRVEGKDHYQVLGVARHVDDTVIAEAHLELVTTFSPERYRGISLGSDQATLEILHRAYGAALIVLGDPESRASYDERLGGTGEAREEVLDVELVFLEGRRLEAAGDLAAAVARYRTAAERRPCADYLAPLGVALTRLGGTMRLPGLVVEGRDAVERALAEDPDHPTALAAFGAALAIDGRTDEALETLERALAHAPLRLEALEAWEEIHIHRQAWRVLEAMYRRLIDRETTVATRVALWTRLGMLYRQKIEDPEAARVAFQQASALAPQDTILRLQAEDPGEEFASEVTRTLAKLRDPRTARPALQGLYDKAVLQGATDAAWVTAGLLVGLGDPEPKVVAAYRATSPARLPVLQPTLPSLADAHWDRFRHVDDDPLLGQLFALLLPMIREVVPLTYEDLGLEPGDVLETLPANLGEIRAGLAAFFGVPSPDLAIHKLSGAAASVGALMDPLVLIGPDLLTLASEAEQAFRLARALSYLRPGRAMGGALRGRVLRALLFASLTMVAPFSVDDPAGIVARGRDWLAGAPSAYRNQVVEVVQRLTAAHDKLDLGRWSAGMARTADRAALIAVGDPAAAVTVTLADSGVKALPDLLEFALSREHLELRRELGRTP